MTGEGGEAVIDQEENSGVITSDEPGEQLRCLCSKGGVAAEECTATLVPSHPQLLQTTMCNLSQELPGQKGKGAVFINTSLKLCSVRID